MIYFQSIEQDIMMEVSDGVNVSPNLLVVNVVDGRGIGVDLGKCKIDTF